MKISAQQTERLSFHHPMIGNKYPPRILVGDYPQVIREIKEGNQETVDRTILSFVPLVFDLVERYCAALGTVSFSDELVSCGFTGVCHAIDQVPSSLTHDNLGAYVKVYMHRYISWCLEKLPLVAIPGSTVRSWKQDGKEIPARMNRKDVSVLSNVKDHREDDFEIRDLALASCECRVEQQIVEGRLAGESDREIAERVSLSLTTVYFYRQDIGSRIQRKMQNANAAMV